MSALGGDEVLDDDSDDDDDDDELELKRQEVALASRATGRLHDYLRSSRPSSEGGPEVAGSSSSSSPEAAPAADEVHLSSASTPWDRALNLPLVRGKEPAAAALGGSKSMTRRDPNLPPALLAQSASPLCSKKWDTICDDVEDQKSAVEKMDQLKAIATKFERMRLERADRRKRYAKYYDDAPNPALPTAAAAAEEPPPPPPLAAVAHTQATQESVPPSAGPE